MAQNEKFAAAIDDGLAAANAVAGRGALEAVVALVRPVVACVREQVENGRRSICTSLWSGHQPGQGSRVASQRPGVRSR